MRAWTIQRPARVWIQTTVNADTLESALTLADEDIASGGGNIAEDAWEINWEEHWAIDDKGVTFA
jgi:hypothetical protein